VSRRAALSILGSPVPPANAGGPAQFSASARGSSTRVPWVGPPIESVASWREGTREDPLRPPRGPSGVDAPTSPREPGGVAINVREIRAAEGYYRAPIRSGSSQVTKRPKKPRSAPKTRPGKVIQGAARSGAVAAGRAALSVTAALPGGAVPASAAIVLPGLEAEVQAAQRNPIVASFGVGADIGPPRAPTLRSDWREHREEILQAARDVVHLYRDLDAIFGKLKVAPSRPGDNAVGEQAEALADFREGLREGEATARLVEEQLQSDEPQVQVLRLAQRMLGVLERGAKWCARLLSEGAIKLLGADLVPALRHKLEKLPHLLHELAALLHHIF